LAEYEKFDNHLLVVLIILGGLYYVTGINDLVVKDLPCRDKNKSGAAKRRKSRI